MASGAFGPGPNPIITVSIPSTLAGMIATGSLRRISLVKRLANTSEIHLVLRLDASLKLLDGEQAIPRSMRTKEVSVSVRIDAPMKGLNERHLDYEA
jgi:hypothetical protein